MAKLSKSKKGEGMDVPSSLGSWVWFVIILVVLAFLLMVAFGPKLKELALSAVSAILGR